MSYKDLLQVSSVLRDARNVVGISQKALAITAGIDQSRLCGLEKGRLLLVDQRHLSGLSRALASVEHLPDRLAWAARHDSVIVAMAKDGFDDQELELVSVSLVASQVLTREEISDLKTHLGQLYASKSWLKGQGHPALGIPVRVEVAML